jgi:hypothetical protein
MFLYIPVIIRTGENFASGSINELLSRTGYISQILFNLKNRNGHE